MRAFEHEFDRELERETEVALMKSLPRDKSEVKQLERKLKSFLLSIPHLRIVSLSRLSKTFTLSGMQQRNSLAFDVVL